MVIGPAGENGVTFSVIENDCWRSAGRTGVGAVMGSKKIKAIAFWGNKTKELADPALVRTFSKKSGPAGQGRRGGQGVQEHGHSHDG